MEKEHVYFGAYKHEKTVMFRKCNPRLTSV